MYQTVGHQGIDLYAEAMGVPLFRQPTQGVALLQEQVYTPTPEDEVEDLFQLLKTVKVRHLFQICYDRWIFKCVYLMSYTEDVLCQVYCNSPVRILVRSILMLWSTCNALCEM